ncbi:PhnD/SsuA/transferrin family substrate-binding protein [Aestuariibacter sp. AA17]|uniref:PhnD/SsuA/transferrin family substrate-binding protein n=1 Tax=Fluctibacter corallii TaxID=2984329 RepID=A0ABT3A901_9ALTE|nr:PhnD/SsuA/transferrin family substrate-binding protein [Aestuariibacter sp. AA17]MCV2884752.1 PhnD/SsuA/transferrin family substrate-binding protein [Aestuariibacter sp. AA17]
MWSSTLLLVLVFWILGRLDNEAQIYDIPNVIIDNKSCLTSSGNNEDEFLTFTSDRALAERLLTKLCTNDVINRQFGRVKVRWSHSDEDVIQYVGKGIADLALVKENLMHAFATQRTHGYDNVAQYQDYATYLFSLKEQPELTKQYLWGKRIGLLDYPSSRSGHIVPKKMLNELGIKDGDVEIVYANSHSALRELLSSGRVDLISSYWHERDSERFSQNYITEIDNNISGSKWYLKMETANTDLRCAVQKTLQTLAKETQSDYYKHLILMKPCMPHDSPVNEEVM